MSEKKKGSQENEAALQARLRQLELENSLRLQRQQQAANNPIGETPRGGFGSRQGIAHLRHTEYQRRGPTPPAPPPSVPEPGKARFGGTYLKTPLPGIIRADSTPGFELVEPVPATPSAPGRPPNVAPPKGAPAQGASPPLPPPGARAPSGAMPAGRPLPGPPASSVPPGKDVAQAKPPGPDAPMPAAAQFDLKRKVVGGAAVPKAPLPAVYHAGMKSAEEASRAAKGPEAAKPPTAPAAPNIAAGEGPIAVPEGAEVLKETPGAKPASAAPRTKRFKNPTLPSKAGPPDPGTK